MREIARCFRQAVAAVLLALAATLGVVCRQAVQATPDAEPAGVRTIGEGLGIEPAPPLPATARQGEEPRCSCSGRNPQCDCLVEQPEALLPYLLIGANSIVEWLPVGRNASMDTGVCN